MEYCNENSEVDDGLQATVAGERKGATSIDSELKRLAQSDCGKCSGRGIVLRYDQSTICSCIPLLSRAELLPDFYRAYPVKDRVDQEVAQTFEELVPGSPEKMEAEATLVCEPEEGNSDGLNCRKQDANEKTGLRITEDCSKCGGFRVVVSAEGGQVKASVCTCVEEPNWDSPEYEEYQRLSKTADEIAKAEIPPLFANASYKGKSFDDVAPKLLLEWLDWACGDRLTGSSNFLFLCGQIGNGKTHMAADCVKRFILRTGRPARFLQAEDLVEAKRDADVYGDRKHRDERHNLDYQKRVVKYAGLLVVDEVGRKRISSWGMDVFEHFVDLRYQSGLPTILISNHTFDSKTSLDGATIDQVVGRRTADRLRDFECIELFGPSKRGIKGKDCSFDVSLSDDEIESFRFGKSILMKKRGELHILNWITRNPVFEPIKDTERKPLRDERGELVVFNGVPLDADREFPKHVKNVWQKGDEMLIRGPVLSCDDAKTYLVCLDLLTEQHRNFEYGITLKVSTSELLKALGKGRAGPNIISTHKSLFRLAQAHISYRDNLGRGWNGPLVTFAHNPCEYGQSYEITFNASMIRFYSAFEYTTLHERLFDAKIGTDGLRMQMFLRSHNSEKFDRMTLEGWLEFLGKEIPEDASPSVIKNERRKHRKKFSELLKKQIDAGLLTEGSSLKRGCSKVALCVTPLN